MVAPKTFIEFIQNVYKADFSINEKYLSKFKENVRLSCSMSTVDVNDASQMAFIYNREVAGKENVNVFCSYQEVQDEKPYPVALYICIYLSESEGILYRIRLYILDEYIEQMLSGMSEQPIENTDDGISSRFDIMEFDE